MNPRRLTVALAISCLPLMQLSFFAQEVQLPSAQQKITMVSAVRARTGPQVTAEEITRLPLGTVISAVGRSTDQFETGGKKDYWYRVTLPDGGPAWVFGGLLADYDAARRPQILRRIIEERLKVETMSFEDGVDFYNFVSRTLSDVREKSLRGELELARLHAIHRTASAISDGQETKTPYRDFYNAHKNEVYHHEFAGGWAIRPELFWSLEPQYRGTPVGERIAWDASQALQQGECESDEVCFLLAVLDTEGRYLGLYPRGSHAEEILQRVSESLSSQDVRATLTEKGGDKYAVEQRTELRKALAGFRVSVSKTVAPQKDAVIRTIDQLLAHTP